MRNFYYGILVHCEFVQFMSTSNIYIKIFQKTSVTLTNTLSDCITPSQLGFLQTSSTRSMTFSSTQKIMFWFGPLKSGTARLFCTAVRRWWTPSLAKTNHAECLKIYSLCHQETRCGTAGNCILRGLEPCLGTERPNNKRWVDFCYSWYVEPYYIEFKI